MKKDCQMLCKKNCKAAISSISAVMRVWLESRPYINVCNVVSFVVLLVGAKALGSEGFCVDEIDKDASNPD